MNARRKLRDDGCIGLRRNPVRTVMRVDENVGITLPLGNGINGLELLVA